MIDPSLRGSPRRRSHCLSSEMKITWSRRGSAGNPGTRGSTGTAGSPGASGATGTTGPDAVSAFSGHVVTVPSTPSGTERLIFGAPDGISAENGAESAVDTLSPSVPITVRDLEVLETGPPVPAADQIVISVQVNGSPTISCVMSAGATSCDSGSLSTSIPARSTLSVAVQANANLGTTIFQFDVLFGFAATSS